MLYWRIAWVFLPCHASRALPAHRKTSLVLRKSQMSSPPRNPFGAIWVFSQQMTQVVKYAEVITGVGRLRDSGIVDPLTGIC